jgi:hypothetical protein
MKKSFLIISIFLTHLYICAAQTREHGSTNEIESVKMEYMNKELNLTPEEAKKFWPVYNQYFAEVKQAKKDHPNDELAFEEKVVGIRKKYKNNFKGILNNDNRVNRVFVSEKNLRDLLKRELQDRQRRKKYPGVRQSSPKRPKS